MPPKRDTSRFDVVLVAAFDRVARRVHHFLDVLDELNHLGIEFISARESIDTGGLEKLPNGLTVKEFLIGPTGQECCSFRVCNGADRKYSVKKHDRVRFHVHHVGEATNLGLCERVTRGR